MSAIEFPLNPVIAQEFTDDNGIIWYCEQDEDSLGIGTGPIWARKAIEKVSTDGSLPMVGQLLLIDQNADTGNPPTDPKHAVSKEYADNNPNGISAIDPLRQTMIGELELPDAILSAIDEQINANSVVDVFIYDTSLDDDGGAWVDKANYQSWFTELGQFPKLCIIVAEAGKVTLYDGNDGSEWMVFNGSVNGTNAVRLLGVANRELSSIAAKNGKLSIGLNGSSPANYAMVDFISDTSIAINDSDFRTYNSNLLNRNNESDFNTTSGGLIINGTINDVALTSDGNMNNTVAVATDSGVSVIHPDGSVADITDANGFIHVDFIDNKLGITTKEWNGCYIGNIVTSTVTSTIYRELESTKWLNVTTGISDLKYLGIGAVDKNALIDNKFLATDIGLSQLSNVTDIPGSIAYQTADYCSGFMYGDIKGAFLANSKTADRSVNNNSLVEVGSITEAPVAAGAELMGYSGFATGSYLEQAYNADLDFGTGDFYVMGWMDMTTQSVSQVQINHGTDDINRWALYTIGNGTNISFYKGNNILNGTIAVVGVGYAFVVFTRKDGVLSCYINGVFDNSVNYTTDITIPGSPITRFGVDHAPSNPVRGSMSLWRLGKGAPTAQQIKEIYDAERPLFQENAKCTLQGTSSDVKSFSFDESTGLLTVCSADHTTKLNRLIVASDEAVVSTSISTTSGKTARGT